MKVIPVFWINCSNSKCRPKWQWLCLIQQAAMRDKWLNSGYYGDQLQPHVEPPREIDSDRVGK